MFIDRDIYIFVYVQSLSKIAESEPRYYQPAMESYEYDQMFYIMFAQVSTHYGFDVMIEIINDITVLCDFSFDGGPVFEY